MSPNPAKKAEAVSMIVPDALRALASQCTLYPVAVPVFFTVIMSEGLLKLVVVLSTEIISNFA